ncbi:uncharacterized membrane protein HdeD (DUF308 family) [Paenarthrobacter nitroguajacolicus]|uniref:DUF308 domain-containing protein n=1 Tax=Paenarthrobacter nitroguajacolicus TaxID=211146 RepID=UPI00285F04E2|nr:DUF308 domain-containing protein [Paenarthrobacter nitroguajacolicus]MDR6988478.1 uncharacterized membrane protein HdeD (DUF308 family) [Paenarthrobacter nitroguajacolicus]
MTLPATPAQTPSASAAGLWKPVLIRAAVALVFGAVTIFWASPSVQVLAWAVGLYLLATAGAVWRSNALPVAVPLVVALGGIGALVTQSDAGVALSAMLALLVLGLLEVVHGLRKRDVLARDWLISGVITVGTAVMLPFFTSLGAHALLGVAGGGAIISGVLWILSGLTLRHDAKTASTGTAQAAGPSASPEAVN